ncbi:MAG TPA: acetyl-CoA C-acyltransferase [Acidimicrobiia bacterium]|nr:acetyl-CoA C-acyltransferase [Acidimicrobiia bacterium]
MDVFIVDACRTPTGKIGGQLAHVRPDDLAAHALRRLIERNPSLDPESIEDVFWGAANQAGEDNRNVARMAVLLARLPDTVPGATVNRLCGSGLQAVISAAHALSAGWGDVMVAGGSESMSRAPWVIAKPNRPFPTGAPESFDTTLGWRLVNPRMAELHGLLAMGETAEVVAERFGVGREQQDELALASHQRAVTAQQEGKFLAELEPIEAPTDHRHRATVLLTADEGPRPDTSLEALSSLRPVFRQDGTVTAGNSSPMNDGAAAVLLTTEEGASRHGLEPVARVVASAAAGVHPDVMGIGPVPATRKALERAGLATADLDLVELNEAFAAQALACIGELKLDPDTVNVNGGAIALGHPLGASGARILTTLVHEMPRRSARYGLATMCIGVGQGIALVIERV